ncbi:hypothetical protein ABZV58_05940 [Nocardia sp. NPDC004654]
MDIWTSFPPLLEPQRTMMKQHPTRLELVIRAIQKAVGNTL